MVQKSQWEPKTFQTISSIVCPHRARTAEALRVQVQRLLIHQALLERWTALLNVLGKKLLL